MARKPPPPSNTRNGLKWRDGRPRWEPSPASRAVGLRGMDLRDLEGRWLTERGEAIAVCDGRQLWAELIRDAHRSGAAGDEARGQLRLAIENLAAPADAGQRRRRALLQDLIDRAGAVLEGQDLAAGVTVTRGVRTMERLTEAYFDAVDRGEVKIARATRTAYSSQRGRLEKKFAGRGVASITRSELRDWYHNELTRDLSTSSANLCMGAAAALFKFAWNKDWIAASPVTKLTLTKAKGRRVFWELAEEQAFVSWCDANGFADVADGLIAGLWTGARLIDLTKLNLESLTGETWAYLPQKTEKGGQEAMPGITAPFRARIDRRRHEAALSPLRPISGTPFLWDPKSQRRHGTRTYWARFTEAQAKALAQQMVPATMTGKRHQDTRDTCITRLYYADVPISRMWTWTGHSQGSIEQILKEHYIVLREAGQREMAGQLEAWAKREGMGL